jgi:hypothetical protein
VADQRSRLSDAHMRHPTDILREGCDILDAVLVPAGFHFEHRDAGQSSGGQFAWGEYLRSERRLELHFRYSLGLVAYATGELRTSHESLARALLGRSGGNAYPGFSDDPLDGFRHLRQDLERFGTVFLRGGDDELRALLMKAINDEQHRSRGFAALFGPDE